ncbi:MAG: penicillin acylase family protein [bacterium]
MPVMRSFKPLFISLAVLMCMAAGQSAQAAGKITLPQRLKVFPVTGLPLKGRVTVYWNRHQVPFIEAERDEDLPFVLGLVQAHLRLGQISYMRMVAQGRLSEMAGPFTKDIDRSLRILNLGRAVPQIMKMLSPDQMTWLKRFTQGINHYQNRTAKLPKEFEVMNIPREAWRPEDVLTIGRLGSVDVNWFVFFRLLRYHKNKNWKKMWRRLVREGTASHPSYTADAGRGLNILGNTLLGMSRSGSNTIAVSAEKSASGGALIASDPHLGLQLPNLWMIVGYKSPSYHVVGLMPAGVPIIALGRNPYIAWGGTNLRAASSDLFDVSRLPPEKIRTRTEKIKVRWWLDITVKIRETAYGPIISDMPLLGLDLFPDWKLALKWMGHQPSNEFGAMLALQRATNWAEFRQAFAGFSVAGQNMLYADAKGHIGQVMAVRLPKRPNIEPVDIVLPMSARAAWSSTVNTPDLPASFDPPQGFLASANNRGSKAQVPIGFFFSSNDRIERISKLLKAEKVVSVRDLSRLQRDVYMASAAALRNALAAWIGRLGLREKMAPDERVVLDALKSWNGHYRAASKGALAFELVMNTFIKEYYEKVQLQGYLSVGRPYRMIRLDLKQADPNRLAEVLQTAFAKAAGVFQDFGTWGGMHRLQLAHPLGRVPLIGSRYRFGNFPASGSSATVMKTAHRFTDEKHNTSYGSNARHISDMSDPDRNYFVLLGGQDGWFGSTTFLSQYPLWEKGKYIQVPLLLETVKRKFPHRMALKP